MTAIHPLTMPKWGLAMTEGTVSSWLAEEGAPVQPGDEVLEIETSKITNVLEAPAGGVLRRRVAGTGKPLPVGALLGVIAEPAVPDAEIDGFVAEFQARFAAEAEAAEAAAPPEPRLADVGGRAIRYLHLGEARGGVPVVMVHGFGGDLNNWLFNLPDLARDFEVLALDLPGHGGSAKDVGAGTVGDLAACVRGLLESLGIARAHLVGQSLGGAVSVQATLDEPGRIASLTLVCPAGLGEEINAAYLQGFIDAQRPKALKALLAELFADPGLISRDMVEDLLKYKRLDGVDRALRTIVGAVAPDGRQVLSYRDALGRLGQPVQVIWGTEDRIIPSSHADGLPDSVPVHRIAGKGHMVHMEAAAEVNRLLAEFLRAV